MVCVCIRTSLLHGTCQFTDTRHRCTDALALAQVVPQKQSCILYWSCFCPFVFQFVVSCLSPFGFRFCLQFSVFVLTCRDSSRFLLSPLILSRLVKLCLVMSRLVFVLVCEWRGPQRVLSERGCAWNMFLKGLVVVFAVFVLANHTSVSRPHIASTALANTSANDNNRKSAECEIDLYRYFQTNTGCLLTQGNGNQVVQTRSLLRWVFVFWRCSPTRFCEASVLVPSFCSFFQRGGRSCSCHARIGWPLVQSEDLQGQSCMAFTAVATTSSPCLCVRCVLKRL